MGKSCDRIDRVGELLQRQLSRLLHKERVCQPFGLVTISHMVVSRDLSHARVLISTLDPDPARVVDALNESAKMLRMLLGQGLHIRRVPTLEFVHDREGERQMRLGLLLARLGDETRHVAT